MGKSLTTTDTQAADAVTDFAVTLVNNANEAFSISDLVESVEIYQSMLNGFMTAKLVLWDRVNMLNTLPLRGEEQIILTLNSAASTEGRTFIFAITSIEEIDIADNLKSQTYCIFLASPEAIRNEIYLISQSYDSEISDIVKKVYTDHLQTKKNLTIEQTGGQGGEPTILAKMRPLEALKMLKNRAVSVETSGMAFFSFENSDGFVFGTPDKFYRSGFVVADYTLNHSATKLFAHRDIISISDIRKVDLFEELRHGYFYSEAVKFDLVNKTPTTVKFDISKDAKWDTLHKGKRHSEKFLTEAGAAGAKRFLIAFDANRKDRSLAETIGQKQACLTNLAQTQIEINVPGNLDIGAGDIVNVQIPDTRESDSGQSQPEMSGKYLVCDVVHHFLGKIKAYTRLQLMKDSFAE